MTRRGHGEGSVYQRSRDGVWVGSVTAGWYDGKRQRKTVYGVTRKEAGEKLRTLQAKLAEGRAIAPARLTVGQLLDRWMEDVMRLAVKATTFERHEQTIRLHLRPSFGHVRLQDLTPAQVDRFLAEKQAGGLSPRSVQIIRGTLRQALNRAMKWGYLTINAAALADVPKQRKRHVEALTAEHAGKVLEAVAAHRLVSLFTVALATGKRQGELLGLRWQDVDMEAGTANIGMNLQRVGKAYVIQTTKADASTQQIALPKIAVAALRARRVQQLEERLVAGSLWQEKDPFKGLIWTTPTGGPVSGTALTHQFQKMLAAAKLPRMRFHDLRHGAASLWLAEGIPLKVVQEALGHATLAVTADIYGHLLFDLQRDAAASMDRALGGKS